MIRRNLVLITTGDGGEEMQGKTVEKERAALEF